MLLDALRHHEIVFLARAIHPCGTEDSHSLNASQIGLALHLALTIGGVGSRCVRGQHIIVRAIRILLLADRSQDTKAADIEELRRHHL